jgi:hypothetical protein
MTVVGRDAENGHHACVSGVGEHRRGVERGASVESRFGVVLLLLLVTFVFLMAGSTSRWARPVGVALTGATLLAALFAADVAPQLRRLAAVIARCVVGSFSLVAFGRSGECGRLARCCTGRPGPSRSRVRCAAGVVDADVLFAVHYVLVAN